MTTTAKRKGRQGFAAMDPEKRRQICSKGGKASHAQGKAHEWKAGEEAQEAGRKGGSIGRKRKKGEQA